jgi:hypothetical protein
MHEILVFYCRIKMYIVWGMWRWRELSMSPLITIRVFVPRRPFNPETTAIHNSRNAPSSKENARYEHAEFFAVIYEGRRRILSIRPAAVCLALVKESSPRLNQHPPGAKLTEEI